MENLNEALIQRLERTVQDGFDELKKLLSDIDARVRAVEKENARLNSVNEIKMDNIEKKTCDHDAKIEELDKDVDELDKKFGGLSDRVKLLMWVGGIIGAAVILYIVGGLLGLL